jgi:hypothetical protein
MLLSFLIFFTKERIFNLRKFELFKDYILIKVYLEFQYLRGYKYPLGSFCNRLLMINLQYSFSVSTV